MVCSRVGGLAEVLQHDTTALLVPSGDPPAIAAAVRRLHADRELRRRLGAAALQVQQARYSLDAMVDAYLAVYQSVLPRDVSHR
jgi:glycosyltransferase involved in cell wall biosynthesis